MIFTVRCLCWVCWHVHNVTHQICSSLLCTNSNSSRTSKLLHHIVTTSQVCELLCVSRACLKAGVCVCIQVLTCTNTWHIISLKEASLIPVVSGLAALLASLFSFTLRSVSRWEWGHLGKRIAFTKKKKKRSYDYEIRISYLCKKLRLPHCQSTLATGKKHCATWCHRI